MATNRTLADFRRNGIERLSFTLTLYLMQYASLSGNDEFLVLADFDSYVRAQEDISRRYEDRSSWARSCLINIAKSSYVSSDRRIRQYAEDIWDVKPIKL